MSVSAKGASHADMLIPADQSAAVDALNLAEVAKAAAFKLLAEHPGVVFTSGRRTVEQQAHAMAGNVARNRQWIAETYVLNDESRSLQKWVDDHPFAETPSAIAAGLQEIMKNWTDTQKRRLSRHFSGQAFDILPVAGQAGMAIKTSIRALPHLRKFLEREGGLIIWHADFEAN